MERDIPNDIDVYYLDKRYGEDYLFIAENIVYKSQDSEVLSLVEYTERHNSGDLDGWVTFRKKENQ